MQLPAFPAGRKYGRIPHTFTYLITNMDSNDTCPCGSEQKYSQCCEPYITGKEPAPTAEKLMRSRYVAYTLKNNDYLLETWHSSTRPSEELPADENIEWRGLEILRTEEGGENDYKGFVEFRAKCRVNGEAAGLDEGSEFVKEDGRWYYVDGSGISPIRTREKRVGRNDPCPCGSGKKFKKCCGP